MTMFEWTVCPEMQGESNPDYEEQTYFPVGVLIDAGYQLTAHIPLHRMKTMNPVTAGELADDIESQKENIENPNTYPRKSKYNPYNPPRDSSSKWDTDIITLLERAIEWLRYWSNQQTTVHTITC